MLASLYKPDTFSPLEVVSNTDSDSGSCKDTGTVAFHELRKPVYTVQVKIKYTFYIHKTAVLQHICHAVFLAVTYCVLPFSS